MTVECWLAKILDLLSLRTKKRLEKIKKKEKKKTEIEKKYIYPTAGVESQDDVKYIDSIDR